MATLSASSTETRWGLETTFGTAPTGVRRRFGWDESINLEAGNGAFGLQNLGERSLGAFTYNTTRVNISADFILSTPWFWGLSFKGSTGSPVNSVYPHTFIEDNTSKTFTLNRNVKYSDAGNTDKLLQYRGCTVQSIGITCSVDEPTRVRLSAESGIAESKTYNYEDDPLDANYDDPDFLTTNITDSFPYTFAFGAITLDSTGVAQVDNIDLTLNTGQPLVYSFGGTNAVSSFGGEMRYSGRMTASMLDSSRFEKLLAREESGSLKLLFTNNKTGSNLRSQAITLTGFTLTNNANNATKVERFNDEITFEARTCSIECNTKHSTIQK